MRIQSIAVRIGLIALVVLAAYVTLAMFSAYYRIWHQSAIGSQPDLRRISELSTITFPKSARLINSRYQSFLQGRDLRAQIEIDKADLPRFLNSLPSARIERHDKSELTLGARRALVKDVLPPVKNLDWWRPEAVRRFIVAESPGTNVSMIRMLISTDDAKRAVVYFFWTH